MAANFGVLVGIVFLVIEVRQNNDNLIAQARATYHAGFAEAWGMAAENPDLAELLARELDGGELTSAEQIQLASYWTKFLLLNQHSFLELPEEESAGNLNYLRTSFEGFPTLRWVWNRRQEFFNPEFVRYINESVIGD